jgi:hypothetical protein
MSFAAYTARDELWRLKHPAGRCGIVGERRTVALEKHTDEPRRRHYENRAKGGDCMFATTTVIDFAPVFRNPAQADAAARSLCCLRVRNPATHAPQG